jgi:hypothetical protein
MLSDMAVEWLTGFAFFGASLLGFLTVCVAVWAIHERTPGRS